MNALNGLRVLNTRPFKQGETLSHAIRDAGGLPIDLPALMIEPTPDDWLHRLPALTSIQHALFISANAVDCFFSRLKETAMSFPDSIRVTAMGTATADALRKHGIQVHHVPLMADSEHLLTLDVLQQIKHDTLLLIKGVGGRTLIAETLRARGARVIPLEVYHSKPPTFNRIDIHSLWQDDALDIILFTSEQGMRNLLAAFAGEGQPWFCSKPCLVISERLATVAASLGMKRIHLCQHDTILTALKGFKHDGYP